jgi:hypothetical protein
MCSVVSVAREAAEIVTARGRKTADSPGLKPLGMTK